jgi:hypothetical protein
MSDASREVVLLDHGLVAEIRLSRIAARNALSTAMAEELVAATGRGAGQPGPGRRAELGRSPSVFPRFAWASCRAAAERSCCPCFRRASPAGLARPATLTGHDRSLRRCPRGRA